MILEMKNIEKSFYKRNDVQHTSPKINVLRDISFTVDKGEVVSIIGPSGSGKSTLLRCATFLETIDSGEIYYMDQPAVTKDEYGNTHYVSAAELKAIKSYYGLVFQQFNLFPHYSVLKNLMDAPVNVQKRDKKEVKAECMELLRKMGLEDRADAYPFQLSGGQQQRVAIARALATSPEIIYFDEPTSALDPELIGEVLAVMTDLAKEGMTMLVVTHEMRFAKNVSNKVVFMDGGHILEQASAAEFFMNPKTERARSFLQGLNGGI